MRNTFFASIALLVLCVFGATADAAEWQCGQLHINTGYRKWVTAYVGDNTPGNSQGYMVIPVNEKVDDFISSALKSGKLSMDFCVKGNLGADLNFFAYDIKLN